MVFFFFSFFLSFSPQYHKSYSILFFISFSSVKYWFWFLEVRDSSDFTVQIIAHSFIFMAVVGYFI